jgi:hypothetical protein
LVSESPEESQTTPSEPERCIIVVNQALSPGRAANAVAVVAFTLGQRHGRLVGDPLVEAGGVAHPGLIPIGIPVLQAPGDLLRALREKAASVCDVVDFPTQGQETNDYAAFQAAVQSAQADSLQYLAVGLVGSKKKIGKLVGKLALFA